MKRAVSSFLILISQRNHQLFWPSCLRLIINSSPGKSTVCPLFMCWQTDSSGGTCALQRDEIGNIACKTWVASLQSLPLWQCFCCVFIISLNLSLHQGSMGKMAVGDEITTINSIPVSKMTYEEICMLMQCLPTSVTLEIQKVTPGERVVLVLYYIF